MKIYADVKNTTLTFEQIDVNGNTILKSDGREQNVSFLALSHNRYSLIINQKSYLLHIMRESGLFHVHIDGAYFPVRVEDEQSRALRQLVQQATRTGGGQKIKAPIPGLITQIKVKEGEKILKGDGLILLEAMKMENEIKSEIDGTVERVLVTQGSPVEKDQELMIIK
jgi:biotin carboxyl carrier protein